MIGSYFILLTIPLILNPSTLDGKGIEEGKGKGLEAYKHHICSFCFKIGSMETLFNYIALLKS